MLEADNITLLYHNISYIDEYVEKQPLDPLCQTTGVARG